MTSKTPFVTNAVSPSLNPSAEIGPRFASPQPGITTFSTSENHDTKCTQKRNLMQSSRREAIAALVLRHSNDRVTRKHYIKPPSTEAVSAAQRLSDTLTTMQKPRLLTNRPQTPGKRKRRKRHHGGCNEAEDNLNAYD